MSWLRREVALGVQVMDVAVAAALLALGLIDVFYRLNSGAAYQGSRAYNAALCVLVSLGVLVRRRWSLPAVVWVVALVCLSRPSVAHDTSFYQGFLPLIVLTAGAAVFEDRRRSIAALVVAQAGLALYLSSEPSLRSVATGISDSLFIALPWAAATIVHARNEQAHRLSSDLAQARAEQAEREREILAEERARIARELHDVVAHSVSVMVLNIGAARLNLEPGDETARQALVVAEDTGRQASESCAGSLASYARCPRPTSGARRPNPT